jgi:hypothetical protein
MCKPLAFYLLIIHINDLTFLTSCYIHCQRPNKHFALYHSILGLEFLNIVYSIPKPFFWLQIHVIKGNLLTFFDDILCFYRPLVTKLDHFIYRTLRLFMYNFSAFSIHYTHCIWLEVFSEMQRWWYWINRLSVLLSISILLSTPKPLGVIQNK